MHFGEKALKSSAASSVREESVVADTKLVCYVMKKSHFEELLGPYEDVWRYDSLRKVGVI